MTKVPKLSKRAEEAVIAQALGILSTRVKRLSNLMSDSSVVKKYLCLKLAHQEREVFGVLFLNIQNKLIADEVMFSGTLSHTSVYPREIIKRALRLNAAALILYHNHPSGVTTPTGSDNLLTESLKKAVLTVDIKIIDHIIVAANETYSYSEKGML